MVNDIKKLLEALPKYPNFMVLHIAKEKTFIKELQDFYKEDDLISEYRILTFSNNTYESLKNFENSFTKVQLVNHKRPKYNHPSKFYDYLFVTFLPKERDDFFKKIYIALKNNSPLFIFLNKDSTELAYLLENELIEKNFVATNIINLDNYLVVSARKMHGWSRN